MRRTWMVGAPHATEIPYVFDAVAAKYGEDLTDSNPRPIRGRRLLDRLGDRERPAAVQDFLARAIQADHVVPAVSHRQAVRRGLSAVAELDRDDTILALLAGDAVDRIGVQIVWVEVTVGGVCGHRPERIHRNILHREPVRGLAVVLLREHVQVN